MIIKVMLLLLLLLLLLMRDGRCKDILWWSAGWSAIVRGSEAPRRRV